MADPHPSASQWQRLRKILEWVAALTNDRGIPLGVASEASEILPDLFTVREVSLPRGPSERANRGESASARRRRVRTEVIDRDGRCAVPGFLGLSCQGMSEIDHFFGRGKAPEDTETCWKLCARHHRLKTNWAGSRAAWVARFIEHAEMHGYGEALVMARRAAALEEGQHPDRPRTSAVQPASEPIIATDPPGAEASEGDGSL
jgi:hypothetical protein